MIIKEVAYKGDSNFNLFFVGRCLIGGSKLRGGADHFLVYNNGVEIRFDIVI